MFGEAVVEALAYVPSTCSLDVADEVHQRGYVLSLRELGTILGESPARAREEVHDAVHSLAKALLAAGHDPDDVRVMVLELLGKASNSDS